MQIQALILTTRQNYQRCSMYSLHGSVYRIISISLPRNALLSWFEASSILFQNMRDTAGLRFVFLRISESAYVVNHRNSSTFTLFQQHKDGNTSQLMFKGFQEQAYGKTSTHNHTVEWCHISFMLCIQPLRDIFITFLHHCRHFCTFHILVMIDI